MSTTAIPAQYKVNSTLLDGLVLEYLHHEGYLNGNAKNPYFDHFENIRALLLEGKISSAIQVCNALSPTALSSYPHLLFRLYKHKFCEILSEGKIEQVIEFCRDVLAPFSQDAFPEAYNEFKRIMASLLNKQTDTIEKCTREERETLSSQVIFALKSTLNIQDPPFSSLIRYLVIHHNAYHAMKGIESQFPVIENFIMPSSSSTPSPAQTNSPTFKCDEKDVMSLVQTLGIHRNAAIESIVRAEGKISTALISELSKVPLNSDLLSSSLLNFAQCRAIINSNDIIDCKKKIHKKDPKELFGDKHEMFLILKNLRKLADEGKAAELLSSVNEIDPSLANTSPHLYFHIHHSLAINMIKNGDTSNALDTIRRIMAPISLKYPNLVREVKECSTFLTITQKKEKDDVMDVDSERIESHSIVPLPKLSDVSGPLFSTVFYKVGMPQSELECIVGYLLHIHNEYYEMIQSNDRFDNILQIDLLKLSDVENRETEIEEKKVENENKADNAQSGGDTNVIDDSVADTLVDILRVSREEAINLLIQFDNNLDNIFASLMS
eukprot:TRINITY_DN3751_c0_g1_i1.p1 TRINITY_DN3751_c0_g1~~TRINITY_DN3751_c0_g1_i1.p1  ORF type:complete len:552 (-),score=114.24 TRINITY_DN3751_c0_g1_i1:883-2538(-)